MPTHTHYRGEKRKRRGLHSSQLCTNCAIWETRQKSSERKRERQGESWIILGSGRPALTDPLLSPIITWCRSCFIITLLGWDLDQSLPRFGTGEKVKGLRVTLHSALVCPVNVWQLSFTLNTECMSPFYNIVCMSVYLLHQVCISTFVLLCVTSTACLCVCMSACACHSPGGRVVLGPYPYILVQVMRPQDRGVSGQVLKVVHDDGHEQIQHLDQGRGEQTHRKRFLLLRFDNQTLVKIRDHGFQMRGR